MKKVRGEKTEYYGGVFLFGFCTHLSGGVLHKRTIKYMGRKGGGG